MTARVADLLEVAFEPLMLVFGVVAFLVLAAVASWHVKARGDLVEDRTPAHYRTWAFERARVVHVRYGLGTIAHRSTMGGAYVRFDDGTTAHCPLADLDPVTPADERALRDLRARWVAMSRAELATAPLPLHCTPGARCRRHTVRCAVTLPPCCPTCPDRAAHDGRTAL